MVGDLLGYVNQPLNPDLTPFFNYAINGVARGWVTKNTTTTYVDYQHGLTKQYWGVATRGWSQSK